MKARARLAASALAGLVRLAELVDRLGPWPGIVLGALGAGLMAWSILELARGPLR